MNRWLVSMGLGVVTWVAASAAVAQDAAVSAHDAWARATVAGQTASGAFVKLKAQEALDLVAVETPLAGVAEIHEMKMEGDVMRMRAMPKLSLPAGHTVELKPGNQHIMLMDLKQTLTAGSQLPLTLVFKNAQGEERRLKLDVPVKSVAMMKKSSMDKSGKMDMSGHKGDMDKAGKMDMPEHKGNAKH